VHALQKVGGNAQPAGAARGLCGHRTSRAHDLVVRAKEQLLHRPRILARAWDAQVALGALVAQDALFCLLDGAHHGRVAVCILVHAYAEVDLVRVGVVAERFG